MNTKQACKKILLLALLTLSVGPNLYAQDSNNILGLPAVPQGPQAAASAGATGSAGSKTPAKPTEAEIKSILAGNLKLTWSYPDGKILVRVVTEKTFVDKAQRAQALQAARLLQRDVRIACGKLCRPEPMSAPTLQPDNTLSFDVVVSGYKGTMTTADMINLASGKPVGPAVKP